MGRLVPVLARIEERLGLPTNQTLRRAFQFRKILATLAPVLSPGRTWTSSPGLDLCQPRKVLPAELLKE